MSLTAGFDLVIELSRKAVLNLVKKNLKIPGAYSAEPPFEINSAFATPWKGQAQLIVTDMELDLRDTDELVFTLLFSCGAVTVEEPQKFNLVSLEGSITLGLPVAKLLKQNGTDVSLGVDWTDATMALVFSPASEVTLQNKLGTLSGQFKDLAKKTLKAFLNSLQVTTDVSFTVIGQKDGKFGPKIQFESVEVHCIGNPDPSKQGLGLFGTLVAANHGKGDHTQKTDSTIAPHRDLALSMAPDAFNRIIFCPSLALSFNTSVDKLPSMCGSSSIDVGGFKVTKIVPGFHPDFIAIDMEGKKSGPCYDAMGSVRAKLKFSLENGKLIPHLMVGDPFVHVDVPWYCNIGKLFLGPAWQLTFGAALDPIVDAIVNHFVHAPGFDNQIAPVAVSGFPGADFKDVLIMPEGLTLQATLPPLMVVSKKSGVTVSGTTTVTDSKVIGTGIYEVKEGCLKGVYPWTEYLTQQLASYFVNPWLLCQPIAYTWWIENLALTPPHGKVKLTAKVTDPFPLPGGTVYWPEIDLEYEIANTGTSIELKNVPNQGNYAVSLRLEAKDAQGKVFYDSWKAFFEGHNVFIQYGEQAVLCSMAQMKQKVKVVPKWPDFGEPNPEELIVITRFLLDLKHPEADALLAGIRLKYGQRFEKAVHLYEEGGLFRSRVEAGSSV